VSNTRGGVGGSVVSTKTVPFSDVHIAEWSILMSKYQELSKTFAASIQLQAKYVSECCAFSNLLFSQMAEYLEWPRDQIAVAPDETAQTEEPLCTSNSVRLREDGNIHFLVALS
jgi:hypothetical protein